MMTRRQVAVVIGLAGIYLGIMGFLSGMVVERIRFDARRNAVLTSLASAEQRLHARLLNFERSVVTADGSVKDSGIQHERDRSIRPTP